MHSLSFGCSHGISCQMCVMFLFFGEKVCLKLVNLKRVPNLSSPPSVSPSFWRLRPKTSLYLPLSCPGLHPRIFFSVLNLFSGTSFPSSLSTRITTQIPPPLSDIISFTSSSHVSCLPLFMCEGHDYFSVCSTIDYFCL